MIYPTYRVAVTNPEELNKLTACLIKCRIRSYISTRDTSIIIDGIQQRAITDVSKTRPELTVAECINIYESFYQDLLNCVNNLKVGDKVVIEARRGPGDKYPCYYSDEMTQYIGHTMTIKSININKIGCSLPYFNGTNQLFRLEEDNGEHIWHSSMFKFDLQKPVTKLKIVPIKINSLIL